MTDAPTPAASDNAAWRQDTLREMIGFEMRLARVVDAEVAVFAEAPRTEGSSKTLERLADIMHLTTRDVRLGLTLHEQFGEDREIRLRRLTAEAERLAQARDDREIAHKRDLVHAAVEGAIEAQHNLNDLEGAPKLRNLKLRLDREVADRETFLDRPAAEIIVRLCRDLRLQPDWRRWDAPWAVAAETTPIPPWRRPPAEPAPEPPQSFARAPRGDPSAKDEAPVRARGSPH
jgi:hypothetical protein